MTAVKRRRVAAQLVAFASMMIACKGKPTPREEEPLVYRPVLDGATVVISGTSTSIHGVSPERLVVPDGGLTLHPGESITIHGAQ